MADLLDSRAWAVEEAREVAHFRDLDVVLEVHREDLLGHEHRRRLKPCGA